MRAESVLCSRRPHSTPQFYEQAAVAVIGSLLSPVPCLTWAAGRADGISAAGGAGHAQRQRLHLVSNWRGDLGFIAGKVEAEQVWVAKE